MSKQALPGKRGNYFFMKTSDLVLVRDKNHFLYDARVDEPLDPLFVDSIDEDGILEPVLVWKDRGEKVLVVAGRQRVRAADKVNEQRANAMRADDELGADRVLVPCIAISTQGLTALETIEKLQRIMILENEKRKDDTPLGIAQKTQRYLEATGGDKVLVAARLKVTTKTVDARLKLLTMAPGVQQAVEQGKIGFWAATELAALPQDQQEQQAGALIKASEGGLKPSVEAAKVAAGKGQARERSARAEAEKTLIAAALDYGAALRAKKPKVGVLSEAKNVLTLRAAGLHAIVNGGKK